MTSDEKSLKNAVAIKALTNTLGGKALIEEARQDVIDAVQRLANPDDKKYEELIGLCFDLRARLDLYQRLTRIDQRIDAIKKIMAEME